MRTTLRRRLGSADVTHWAEAPGARVRAVHYPGGGRGTVLLLNGRTEFVEKYAETVAALQHRGFAVWAFDWRGQGLSTRPLPDRLKHHVGGFAEYLDDLDAVLDGLVLPGLVGPLVLMGHSMGGHLAAHALRRRPGVFARAVLLAPMMDFLRGPAVARVLARGLIGAVAAVPAWARAYGPGTPRAPVVARGFGGNRLTTCPERFAADMALARDTPAVQLGGVTWGWLRAAQASIGAARRPGFAEAIGCPVLVLLAGEERVVDNEAARAFARRLPRATVTEVPHARHELLRERDGPRLAAWAAIDAFLDGLGGDRRLP